MSREFQSLGAKHLQTRQRILAALFLIPASALLLGPRLWAEQAAPVAARSTSALAFDHAEHAKRLKSDDCSFCHKDPLAAKPAPTTRSHTPCLASGCHIDDFLSTGPRALKDSPKAYAAATLFCATCHLETGGKPPQRFAKAAANALFENKEGASFHVEMNHHAHSGRTSCSTCHVVDAMTFMLVAGGPNHTECKSCHEDSEQPMSACKSCHSSPGPKAHFTKARKTSDVRTCTADTTSDRPCFKHEREEHRFQQDKSPLECSSCHYMFKKRSNNGNSYTSLADVKAAPIIDNRRDMAHKSCGARGCHRREVDDSMGTGKCSYCHSKRFLAAGMFD